MFSNQFLVGFVFSNQSIVHLFYWGSCYSIFSLCFVDRCPFVPFLWSLHCLSFDLRILIIPGIFKLSFSIHIDR
jgi:hypothetical protein